MTVKSLPAGPEGRPFARENRDLPSSAMVRWNGSIRAAKSDDNSISVFDVIGADWYGDGVIQDFYRREPRKPPRYPLRLDHRTASGITPGGSFNSSPVAAVFHGRVYTYSNVARN